MSFPFLDAEPSSSMALPGGPLRTTTEKEKEYNRGRSGREMQRRRGEVETEDIKRQFSGPPPLSPPRLAAAS